MKRLILVLICLSVVGCTQSKLRNVAVCQKMAEGYLDSQAVGTYYLVTTQQEEQGVRLFYRLQQSYKITQTEPRIFQCIEQPQGTFLNAIQGGIARTLMMLPKSVK
ncbi:hypothetical protein [Acinetobacter sp. MB5]|uniref:hypothetical protein n=1 Tax=Acinetobacter sp. MB5 TaxID=2069438 RepID=UPI000DCFACFB|nr:hypothetical protein [Acinetobacter sp. MB5]